ncbi:MAG: SPFH domain-containing protein [Andreesenia angusta]|nr:SPFH domain-containing protein [Andreesenia angusta]
MGFFGNQFSNVVEWEEYNDEVIFWKWANKEIKKGSKLIIRQGQDAIFIFNGKVEGIFVDEGSFDIETEIVPFLSTLKGFKFGFNSGMRAEVLFINTKEFTIRWGTKNAINIPAQGLPGGMPIRAFGTFNCKVDDYNILIEKIAGIKQQFTVEDIKERVISVLDQLIMKWISLEGKDMFNLQANSFEIAKGIREDLDMEMRKIGIEITGFNIGSVSYPEEIQEMANKAASQSMVGDMNKYTQMAAADSMANANGGSVAGDMMNMQMGMMMGKQMVDNMQNPQQNQAQNTQAPVQGSAGGQAPKFCPECGNKTEGAKFCSNCGNKLV